VIAAHASDASPRLAHELGALPPARQYQRLDLHRMSASQATHALHTTITQARADGEIYVIVICGKGTHSGAVGPVLSRLVVEELSGPLAAQIVAFRTAPRALGGEGAIVVRLRRKARPKAP
jgi:DNA-nicking Smr family endonuclease